MPQFALKWNEGVNNWMAYVTGNITVGLYHQQSLANLGIGHQALDAGGGYTYFNPQTGYEFSSVVGLTYNFENTHTQYKNGVDMHWDMGASRFVTKEWQIGAGGLCLPAADLRQRVGRPGRLLQVAGRGDWTADRPPVPGWRRLPGLREPQRHGEFAAQARPEGWNVWLTLRSRRSAEAAAPPATRRIVK